MQKKFLKPEDPRLTTVSQVIPENKITSPGINRIIKEMLRILEGERKEKRKGVGLAAPQIGILKRIIIVDVKADGKQKVKTSRKGRFLFRVYINPEITWKSKREGEWYEGCFSTGNVCGIVSRSSSIRIKAFTITPQGCKPKLLEEKWSGYVARIFQHEIDHLNGKVFVDHIKNPDKLHWVEENEFQDYRKNWNYWPKKCPFSKWEKIKKPL